MNAPTSPLNLLPEVSQRPLPAALIEALQALFGVRCSTALVVREQHGRDESPFDVPPPGAVVFAHSAARWRCALRWPLRPIFCAKT